MTDQNVSLDATALLYDKHSNTLLGYFEALGFNHRQDPDRIHLIGHRWVRDFVLSEVYTEYNQYMHYDDMKLELYWDKATMAKRWRELRV